MSAVARIDSDIFQGLAFRADVVVLLGYVGELLYSIEITRPIGIFFHPDIRSDAAFIEPLQKLAVAVGVICRQSLRQVAVTFAVSVDHGPRRCALVTEPCRSSLHAYDDATAVIDQIVVVITQSCRTTFGRICRIRIRGRDLLLLRYRSFDWVLLFQLG